MIERHMLQSFLTVLSVLEQRATHLLCLKLIHEWCSGKLIDKTCCRKESAGHSPQTQCAAAP